MTKRKDNRGQAWVCWTEAGKREGNKTEWVVGRRGNGWNSYLLTLQA